MKKVKKLEDWQIKFNEYTEWAAEYCAKRIAEMEKSAAKVVTQNER